MWSKQHGPYKLDLLFNKGSQAQVTDLLGECNFIPEVLGSSDVVKLITSKEYWFVR